MVFISGWVMSMKYSLLNGFCCLLGLSVLSAVIVEVLNSPVVDAKEYSISTTQESVRVNAKILESPEPEIPAEYQHEAFKSAVTARFAIQPDGKFAVTLVEGSGNEEIDRIVLTTLKKWKFKAATLDEHPIESTRKIRIEIEVE